MPKLKGGYKIVSLNGLDLVGESLAIAGLYDKLANSYNKPILVTGIVIDGEKKKNAFVQVEVLDDGIKINDLYGYDLLVEEDGDITVSANPQELPSTAEASAGNALLLDAQKKPVWGAVSGGTKLCCITIGFGSGFPESSIDIYAVYDDPDFQSFLEAIPEPGTVLTSENIELMFNKYNLVKTRIMTARYVFFKVTKQESMPYAVTSLSLGILQHGTAGSDTKVWSNITGETKSNKVFNKVLKLY